MESVGKFRKTGEGQIWIPGFKGKVVSLQVTDQWAYHLGVQVLMCAR